MMRCIAVDDEKLVLDLLEDNIRQVPFLELVHTCRHALEALAILQDEKIDLIFLDIQMPRLNGLQFIQSLPNPLIVILVTAYEQYALEGFNVQAVDYLLKPVSFDRFLKACRRAYERYQLKTSQMVSPKSALSDFFVHVEYTMVKVVVADIAFVEGLKDYIKIHLSSSPKPIITRMSIKAIEEKLPAPTFIRTHKSFLVAAHKITTIKRDFVCIGEKEIPFSEFYKDNVNRILNPPGV
jgi:DNA-binding LytR/AlgR family response regulator